MAQDTFLTPTARQVLATLFGVLAGLSWVGFGVAAVVLGPRYQEFFMDFGYALPGLSLLALRFSTSVAAVAIVVIAALAVTGVAIFKQRVLLAIVSLCLAWMSSLVFILAMQLPLVDLLDALGSVG